MNQNLLNLSLEERFQLVFGCSYKAWSYFYGLGYLYELGCKEEENNDN